MYANICKQMLMVVSAVSNRQCITYMYKKERKKPRNQETKKQNLVKLKDQCLALALALA